MTVQSAVHLLAVLKILASLTLAQLVSPAPGAALHDRRETSTVKWIVSDDPSDAPRQEHQVGCFLSIFEERLARRADPRAHGQATS